jgi:hypothetical protein
MAFEADLWGNLLVAQASEREEDNGGALAEKRGLAARTAKLFQDCLLFFGDGDLGRLPWQDRFSVILARTCTGWVVYLAPAQDGSPIPLSMY